MHIVIDCREWNARSGAGISHYIEGMVKALLKQKTQHYFSLFFSENMFLIASQIFAKDTQANCYFVKKSIPFWSSHVLFAQKVMALKPDLFFAPAGQLPLFFRGRSVVTIHDLAIYLHPEWFPGTGIGKWFSTRWIVPRSIRRASKILAVSESTKNDLLSLFAVPSKKIHVVYPGIDVPHMSLELFSLQKKYGSYFLFLGTFEPRKNIGLIIKAFDLFLERHPSEQQQVSLMIAGKRGWNYEALIEEIERVNKKYAFVGHSVILEKGYVTNQEKWELLQGATLFLFPSFYEGFGIPVLEALSVGVPVITAKNSSLAEIGSQEVVFVSVENPQEMMKAMEHSYILHENPSLPEQRKKYASQFSWKRAAKITLEIFESLKHGLQIQDKNKLNY